MGVLWMGMGVLWISRRWTKKRTLMTNAIHGILGCCRLLLPITAAIGLALGAEPVSPMSKAEVKELISKSSTAEDHHRIAAYFKQKADVMDAEAAEHEDLAREYSNGRPTAGQIKHPMSSKTAAHCRYFAQAARKAATEDRALAAAKKRWRTKCESDQAFRLWFVEILPVPGNNPCFLASNLPGFSQAREFSVKKDQEYRLKRALLGIHSVEVERTAVVIPEGARVTLLCAPLNGYRLVDVHWEGKTVMLFTEDLREHGTPLEAPAPAEAA